MGLMKKLTSAIVASSLVFSLVGTAAAAYTPSAGETAGARMQKLGIVQGREGGDLQLNAEITRAELVTIIVRAFGQEQNAALLKGSTVFPDIANHWASGNIAMAQALVQKAGGDAIGMPDGKFNPEGKLTPAQAVAFLMKFLGVKRDATKAWPQDYLSSAVTAGLITSDDAAVIAPMLNQNATRGLVFYMFDRAFATYPVETGKTFYTKYVDTVAPVLTVNKVDATTVDNSVTITGTAKDATEVFVGAEKATLNADGTFSFKYALPELKDYSITVTAKDLAGNSTTAPVAITRTTGTADSVAATFDTTLKAGATTDVKVEVKDKAGNVIKDAAYDVTVDAAVGTYADGKITAAAVPGTGKVTVTSGTATKSYDVAVVAGDLAKLVVTPATVDLTVGATQKFTVAGQDANGNAVAAPANVTWTASKGFVAADGTFAATNDVTGTVTLTATAGTVSGTATATVFGAPAKVVVAAPTALVANGVSTTDLVATVQDANGNVVKNYSGTLTFVNSNGTIATMSGTTATAVNGQAKITLTAGTAAGTTVVSVSAAGVQGTTAIVTSNAQVATSVKVTADPATLAADGQSVTNLSAVMLDQTGNPVVTTLSGWTIDYANSDTTVLLQSSSTNNGFSLSNSKLQTTTGSFTAKNNLGTANITATVKKDGTASTTVTANAVSVSTALVGVPYKLAIDTVNTAKAAAAAASTGENQYVYVRVLDVNGNQVTSASNGTIALSVSDDSATASQTSLASWTGGKAKAVYTDTKAETVNYTATATWTNPINNQVVTLTSATAAGSFIPGPAVKVTVAAAPTTLAATGNATSTVKASITDYNGNAVSDGAYSVKFTKANTAGSEPLVGWADQTLTTSNGTASFVVTGGTAVGTDRITATVDFSGNGGNASTTAFVDVATKILGAPNQLAFESVTGVAAGTAATVKVDVKDYAATAGAANVVSYDNNTAVTLTATDSNGNVTTYTANDVNGVATFSLTLNTADTYTLKATATGLKGATGTSDNGASSLVVGPATATGLVVTSNLSTLGADGSTATITVKLADSFGNSGATGTVYGLSLTNGSSAIGGLSSVTYYNAAGQTVTDSTAVKAVATFTASTTPGSTTVTATKSGLTSGSVTLNTMVIGAPAKLAAAVDGNQKVTVGANAFQKVTVTVLDANGNRVTNFAGYVKLTDDSSTNTIYNNDQATVGAVAQASSGAYSFYVKDTKAATVNYTAQVVTDNTGVTPVTSVASATVAGVFTNEAATQLTVAAAPATIYGNGSNITVLTISVKDANGNVVTDANGTVKFFVTDGGNYAYLNGAGSDGWYSATVTNGQAIAILQSRAVTDTHYVSVKANYTANGATTTTITDTTFSNVVQVLNP
jgi:hypothetical protein